MEIFSNLFEGFQALLGTGAIPWWQPGIVIMGGVMIGLFVGVMPGLSASTGLALMVPFTFGMHPMIAIILLASIYLSAAYGGTITAIAINTPGTPAAVPDRLAVLCPLADYRRGIGWIAPTDA